MDNAIELRHLRYFLAVCDSGNIGRAATLLHIAQPPLSRQIRQLETRLGVQLFVRSRQGVTPTAAARALLPQARAVLAQMAQALQTARAAAGEQGGRFSVGYVTVFDRSVFPESILTGLATTFPHWQLQSTGRHSIDLVRALGNGSLDAAFIGIHTAAPGLTTETLLEEPLAVALPSGHRLARKRTLRFDDLQCESLFWFERHLNPGYHDYSRRLFERAGFHPVMQPEPPDHHILLGLIADGHGIGLIAPSLASIRRHGVVFRPLREALRIGIALAYSPENRSPVLPVFIERVRQHFARSRQADSSQQTAHGGFDSHPT